MNGDNGDEMSELDEMVYWLRKLHGTVINPWGTNMTEQEVKFMGLPADMREKISKLAKQYSLATTSAMELYSMGGDHADTLCQLASAGLPRSFIEMENKRLWEKRNTAIKVMIWQEENKVTVKRIQERIREMISGVVRVK